MNDVSSDPLIVTVPQINPNDEQAILVCWHVESGGRIEAGQPLATLETTKAAFDVEAPRDGFAFYELEPKALIAVGAALAYISSSEKARGAAAPRPNGHEPAASEAAAPRFTRKALKLMRTHGLSENDFETDAKIDAEQVERAVRRRAAPSNGAIAIARPLDQSASKILEVQKLGEVYAQVVPSSVAVALDSVAVDAHVRRLGADVAAMSLLELVIFETGHLIADWPDLHGFYEDGQAWTYCTVAIGFAVNLGRSLRVPVVRSADRLSRREVTVAVRDLALRYLRDELRAEDLTSCTFTITDLSTFGVVQFVPVLNHKQSAILGICAERPGTKSRELVLSFDHRLSDGMRAAQFLMALRARLEGRGESG